MSPIFLQATTTTTFLLLSLLLPFTPTTTTADIVHDSLDRPVVAGSYYLGLSLAFTQMGPYGGITMFNTGTVGCPSFIVAQSNMSNWDFGIPIKLTPQISTENNLINISSNINIAFMFLRPQPLCRRRYTTVWTVSGADNGNKVVLNGEEGSNGSWFKLEKTDNLSANNYRIFYGQKMVLYHAQPNGELLLNLEKGYPFIVRFFKIHESESESTTTTPSDSLEMPRFPSPQGLLAKKYSNVE